MNINIEVINEFKEYLQDFNDRRIHEEISLLPTEEMAKEAKKGLELRKKYGIGGTLVGVMRARDIKNRKNISPSTVRRMHSFFSRHKGNEKLDNGVEKDRGYIAHLLWGGDSGRDWVERKVKELEEKGL